MKSDQKREETSTDTSYLAMMVYMSCEDVQGIVVKVESMIAEMFHIRLLRIQKSLFCRLTEVRDENVNI